MAVPHLDHFPTPDDLRRIVMGRTVYPVGRMPWCVGRNQILANAAGWCRDWGHAAVYGIPPGDARRDGKWEARLVLAIPVPGKRRPHWLEAVVCTWDG